MNNFYFAELGSIKKEKNYYYEYKKHIFIKKIKYNDSCYGLDILSNHIYTYYQNGNIQVNQDTIIYDIPFNSFFPDNYFDEKDQESALNDIKKVIYWLISMRHIQLQIGSQDTNLYHVNNFFTLINLVRINYLNKEIILKTFQNGLKWLLNEENDLLNQLYIAIERDDLVKALELDQKLDVLSKNFHKSVEELNNKLSEKEFGKYI